MHQVTYWLRREWMLLVMYSIFALWRWRAERDKKRAALEGDAAAWPTVEGEARCSVWLYGWYGFRLTVKASTERGEALWTRVFPLKEEADYYARALRGRSVAVHVNPEESGERILCWSELRTMALPFVSETMGRLTRTGWVAARLFQVLAFGSFGLALVDFGIFVYNRDFQWRGMCACDLSIGLLGLGTMMLVPARVLRVRMRAVPLTLNAGSIQGAWRSGMVWLTGSAAVLFAGMLVFSAITSWEIPDAGFYLLLTAPVFPILWWSMAVSVAAGRELRPLSSDGSRSGPRGGRTDVEHMPLGEEIAR